MFVPQEESEIRNNSNFCAWKLRQTMKFFISGRSRQAFSVFKISKYFPVFRLLLSIAAEIGSNSLCVPCSGWDKSPTKSILELFDEQASVPAGARRLSCFTLGVLLSTTEHCRTRNFRETINVIRGLVIRIPNSLYHQWRTDPVLTGSFHNKKSLEKLIARGFGDTTSQAIRGLQRFGKCRDFRSSESKRFKCVIIMFFIRLQKFNQEIPFCGGGAAVAELDSIEFEILAKNDYVQASEKGVQVCEYFPLSMIIDHHLRVVAQFRI